MKTATALVVCMAVAVAQAYIPMGPPVAGSAGGRVVGGKPAVKGQNPWQISLNANSWFGKSHICGGSLRDANTAITAAHCCDGQTDLYVLWGGLDRTKLANERKVAKILAHPQYNGNTIDYDYCLLRLASPAAESDGVQFATLASSSPADNANALLTGWGKTSGSSSALPTALQAANFAIVTQAKCHSLWSDVNTVTPRMICAAHASASGCNGDSGGPLSVGNELVGIVSWGSNGCPADTTKRPTVYADVANQRTWLSQTVA